jgi:hypothetical protein
MDIGWNEIIGVIIGAVVAWLLDFIKEQLTKKGIVGGEHPPELIPGKYRVRNKALLMIGGGLVGLVAALVLVLFFQKPLARFEYSTENWVYAFDTKDASTDAIWDAREEALRAEFNFALFGDVTGDEEPRATYIMDNLLGTSDRNWTGYQTLKLKATNLTSHPLEMTFSVFKQGCFYEFGDYQDLPPFETKTITFYFMEAHYKTCELPLRFSNSLGSADEIQRLDIILGVNASLANLSRVQGDILIDNVRLEKDVRYLLIGLGLVVLVIGVGVSFLLRRKPGR